MRTIKVKIRNQMKRFNQLNNAMMKNEQVEGYYVMEYRLVKEQGEMYAKFTLRDADDETTQFWSLTARDR